MASAHETVESNMEKGTPAPGPAQDQPRAQRAARRKLGRFHAPSMLEILQFTLFLLSLVAVIVLAIQVAADQREYNALKVQYNEMMNDMTTTAAAPSTLVMRDVNGGGYTYPAVTTSTALPTESSAAEAISGQSTEDDNCTSGITESGTAATVSTSATGSDLSSTTADDTSITGTTTMTIGITATATATVFASENSTISDVSSADALSGSDASSTADASETTVIVTRPVTATATLSTIATVSDTTFVSPSSSSSSQGTTASSSTDYGCIPGFPKTITEYATMTVMPATSSEEASTPITTISVTTALITTITTVISGESTVLVTHTVGPSVAFSSETTHWTNTSAVDAVTASLPISSPLSAFTVLTVTSTESRNSTFVASTGLPSSTTAFAAVPTSGGNGAPKPPAAGPKKSGMAEYCAVMLVAVAISVMLL